MNSGRTAIKNVFAVLSLQNEKNINISPVFPSLTQCDASRLFRETYYYFKQINFFFLLFFKVVKYLYTETNLLYHPHSKHT